MLGQEICDGHTIDCDTDIKEVIIRGLEVELCGKCRKVLDDIKPEYPSDAVIVK